MTDPLFINAGADGAPEYAADELRRNMSVLLLGGHADRTGARAGVRPGTPAVTLAGTWVMVNPTPVVVYPGETSNDGPYLGHLAATEHLLDPQSTNPRIDLVVMRVYDDDHDASGRRELVTELIPGDPSVNPEPPAAPFGSTVLATVDVPPDTAASLDYVAPHTVANGGVLPVRTSDELPTAGLYDGMTAFNEDDGSLLIRHGADWAQVGTTDLPMCRWSLNSGDVVAGLNERRLGSMSVDWSFGGAWGSGDHSSTRVIPRDGFYQLALHVYLSAAVSNARMAVRVRKNPDDSIDPSTGETIAFGQTAIVDGSATGVASGIVQLAAGDVLVPSVLHTADENLELPANDPTQNFAEVHMVRPL